MREMWQGWMDLGPRAEDSGRGPWLDLTQPLHEGMAYFPAFPPPRFQRLKAMPEDPLNLTEMQLVCHVGTHVDAPCHFVADGPSIDEVPFERFYGPGVVWRMKVEPYDVIAKEDLERMEPTVQWGDCVLLDTGWWELFDKPRYDEHYSLSPDAAQWLVERGVRLLGVDCGTVDLPHNRRTAGFNWPVHRILLSHGVLISEHLTNLRALAGKRIEAMFLPLPIRGSDGAPARVIARAAAE
ncbi:MAG: cyclase family protein [Deltaproteobacteria bacterium]